MKKPKPAAVLPCSPSFCAEGGSSRSGASYDAVSDRELAFVAEQLRRGAHNGSAWNYLRGLLALPGGDGARLHDERLPQLCCTVGWQRMHLLLLHQSALHVCIPLRGMQALSMHAQSSACMQRDVGDAPGIMLYPSAVPKCRCMQILAEEPSCSGALELLADVYAARAQAASRQQDSETAAAAAANAAALWQELVIADPVRRRYWQCRAAQLDACMAG